MPKLVDADAQRREICSAARAVFARRGLEGTGLTHVARAAGMARSSLYHYFPDKGSLVRALIREQLDGEEALFRSILHSPGTPRERIERLMRGQSGLFVSWAAMAGLTLDLWSRHAPRFRGFFARLRGEVAAVIAEGQSSGEIDAAIDAEAAAAMLIGAIDGLLLQYLVDRKAFPDLEALGENLALAARKMLAA